MKRVALALAMCIGLPSVSWAAATVEVLAGTVSVNQGKGYQKVTGIYQVNTGDRVLVDAGGKANIVYTDGTFIALGETSKIATIVVPETVVAGALTATTIVTGVLVGGAIVGGVMLATNSSDSKPASP